MAISRETLLGEWVHSHEEDAPGQQVFRRPAFAFPPARGRDTLELKADGTAMLGGPGPTDVPEARPGTWELEGETLRLSGGAQDGTRHLEIASVDPEQLVVRE